MTGDGADGGDETTRGTLRCPAPDASPGAAATVTVSLVAVSVGPGVRYSRDTASRRISCCRRFDVRAEGSGRLGSFKAKLSVDLLDEIVAEQGNLAAQPGDVLVERLVHVTPEGPLQLRLVFPVFASRVRRGSYSDVVVHGSRGVKTGRDGLRLLFAARWQEVRHNGRPDSQQHANP